RESREGMHGFRRRMRTPVHPDGAVQTVRAINMNSSETSFDGFVLFMDGHRNATRPPVFIRRRMRRALMLGNREPVIRKSFSPRNACLVQWQSQEITGSGPASFVHGIFPGSRMYPVTDKILLCKRGRYT